MLNPKGSAMLSNIRLIINEGDSYNNELPKT